ncbi:hypothetical protein AGOR_G00044030 [Albula goreensis]|uniref:Ig-like domain-containing protein n=1 Tax=Albula goreensis TaxID=1534307 RepID=A0A8T3E2A2_9TELE|nr:hypothetical protein AGOR_G00044030 [Albula goreensis]
MYYDSNIKEAIPKTQWIEHPEGKNYWDTETQRLRGEQQRFKPIIENVKTDFNHTQGLHTLQQMVGCEWDDETGATDGFWKYGYDGEDFLAFDMKIMLWKASVPQASSFAERWNNNQVQIESEKLRLTQECTDWLKKYVSYGRRVRPEVSLFQKNSSSPVVCHATGFFPRGIMVTWQRDGEEVQEDVEQGETLPNGDGTFRITSRLTVKPEDLENYTYTCIVKHKSLKKYIIKLVTEKELNKIHSLKYFYTGVTGGTALPEFSAVGLVDDEQFMYYDSKINKAIPKSQWMEKAENEFLVRENKTACGQWQSLRDMIVDVMMHFNHTQGVHTLQQMFGCEWDYTTGLTDGFWKYGYDGEDFLIFDMKIMLWNASVPQASSFALKWNHNQTQIESEKLRLTQECTDWLKKYVNYRRSTLERRVPPEVSLFQKNSSSPVVCHATGFFPRGINVTWQSHGEEVHEELKQGETLPNGDGTFQITSRLTVKPEDWRDTPTPVL